MQSEEQRSKRIKKTKWNLRETWDMIKYITISIMWYGRKKRKEDKKYSKK